MMSPVVIVILLIWYNIGRHLQSLQAKIKLIKKTFWHSLPLPTKTIPSRDGGLRR